MKKKFELTLLLSILCSILIGCTGMQGMQGMQERETIQTRIIPEGTVGLYYIKQVPAKDFTVVRRIFLTSIVVIEGGNVTLDGRSEGGKIIIDGRSSNISAADALQSSKVITYEMLIREVMRHGADDFINLVVEIEDTRGTISETSLVDRRGPGGGSVQQTKTSSRRTITYKATALAIKYK